MSDERLHEDARRYEEGYRRIPEDAEEAEAYGAAASEILSWEDWGGDHQSL